MTEKSGNAVVLLGTGGTISGRADRAADNVGYTTGLVGIDDLARGLRGAAGTGFELRTEQIAQIDSKDMSFAEWQRLAIRCRHHLAQEDVGAVVITHGTDTLEETAYFLHLVLADSGAVSKPVILTAAMRPASSTSPDGPQNLQDALAVAAHDGASGVVVVVAGTVFAGRDVQKVHTYRLDAFDASDAGALGYVEEGRLRMVRDWPWSPAPPLHVMACLEAPRWPRVDIVMNYAGASGFMVDALLAHGDASGDPVRGLVVAGTGNGTLHRDLEAALLRARQRGVAVVRSTRCTRGRVLATAADSLPDSDGLSPVKARVAMMLRLMEQGGSGPVDAG